MESLLVPQWGRFAAHTTNTDKQEWMWKKKRNLLIVKVVGQSANWKGKNMRQCHRVVTGFSHDQNVWGSFSWPALSCSLSCLLEPFVLHYSLNKSSPSLLVWNVAEQPQLDSRTRTHWLRSHAQRCPCAGSSLPPTRLLWLTCVSLSAPWGDRYRLRASFDPDCGDAEGLRQRAQSDSVTQQLCEIGRDGRRDVQGEGVCV